MAWRTPFLQQLATLRHDARYILEGIKVPFQATRPFGTRFRLSSFLYPQHEPYLTAQGASFSGGVLSTRDWTCSPLMFSVGIMGDAVQRGGIAALLQRGQAVALKVGFTEDPDDFEVVALGTIRNVSRQGDGWVIECRGLEGSLNSRITRTAANQQLNHSLSSTTVATNYTASDANIILTADPSAWTGGGLALAVLKVTPTSGDDFYITYDPSAVTGAGPYTVPVTTAGAFGTTDANAAAGKAVTEVAYDSGHPCEILGHILTSSGTGNNGAYDVLPAAWGFGIPEAYVSARDIDYFKRKTQPTSGADDWAWVQPAALEDPQSTFQSWGSGSGVFLTQHQGELTARRLVSPWVTETPGTFEITDAMIVPGSLRYDAWDPDSPVEYSRSRILYADGTTATTATATELDHIPSRDIAEHTAGGVWSSTANASNITAEILSVVRHWDQRVPEILRFSLIGWFAGATSPGDVVWLTLASIFSRDGASYYRRPALVLRCSADWFGSSTEMEVAVLPSDETTAWRA